MEAEVEEGTGIVPVAGEGVQHPADGRPRPANCSMMSRSQSRQWITTGRWRSVRQVEVAGEPFLLERNGGAVAVAVEAGLADGDDARAAGRVRSPGPRPRAGPGSVVGMDADGGEDPAPGRARSDTRRRCPRRRSPMATIWTTPRAPRVEDSGQVAGRPGSSRWAWVSTRRGRPGAAILSSFPGVVHGPGDRRVEDNRPARAGSR